MADNILKNIRIKHRSDTEAKWASQNPVLLNGELAISSDKSMFKAGDGTSTWSQLSYNSAFNDSTGQNIRSTYLKKVTASGQTLTLTKGDNTTSTISTQDTRNTAGSTNSSSKLFLIGASTQSASPQTYSRSTCYIGTDGCLYSNGSKTSVEGHSHNYLPLTGGTVTGTINTSKTTGTYLAGNQGASIINSTAASGNYVMLAKLNSSNGYFTHGSYFTEYLLNYTSQSAVAAGTNGPTKQAVLLDESGNSKFPGTITAGGELRSTSPNGFRNVCGNYGFFIRNDGDSTYFMLTNKGDQYGNWNNLRPIVINDANGIVLINGYKPLLMTGWNGTTLNITYAS